MSGEKTRAEREAEVLFGVNDSEVTLANLITGAFGIVYGSCEGDDEDAMETFLSSIEDEIALLSVATEADDTIAGQSIVTARALRALHWRMEHGRKLLRRVREARAVRAKGAA